MQYLLKGFAPGILLEHQSAEAGTIQLPRRQDDAGTERGANVGQGRLSGLYDVPRHLVGVDDRTPSSANMAATRVLPLAIPPVRPILSGVLEAMR